MLTALLSSLKKGIRKTRENPQLVYTVVVAAVIVAAFAVMAERFVGLATDAQERLVNVRVGSLQDAFASFAADRLDDPGYLNDRIADVMRANETIREFRVVARRDGESVSGVPAAVYEVIASSDPAQIGSTDIEASFLYSLASTQPSSSFTIQSERGGERLFNTARAVVDRSGAVTAVVMTVQTLSEADRAIEASISSSVLILVAVVAAIVLLFLRHSKIIDYAVLYKRLKEVDQLKDDFLSMASHELRTPLASIRGYAEFIREAPDLSGDTKQFAERIDISARDLDGLVADMLDVSRIEQGRMSFKAERVDPAAVAKDVVDSLAIPAKDKGLSLFLDLSRANPADAIVADRDRLKQALVNIAGNAVKYTLKGEVKVSVYAEGGKLFVRVSDTGIGMSAEERERLFERFYRIKTKETEGIKGTGLGLWITAQIVKEMGGTIAVESIKGVGSHFILSFPLASAA